MRNTRNGFTLAEVLVALAIMGLLLAALATAFNASIINYSENVDIAKTNNNSRLVLYRITTQLRTAGAVDPDAPANECTLITSDGDDVTYRYNSDDNTLYLVTNDDLSDSDYVLCDNVTAMSFIKNTATQDSVVYVKSVQISITVESGNVQQTVSTAAVIRRNLN